MEFLDCNEDLEWLFSTHLSWMANHAHKFKSAILYGNEDAPERIDLYTSRDPLFEEFPTIVTLS